MPAPALSRGDVVLTQFPFTDLTGTSLRPALVRAWLAERLRQELKPQKRSNPRRAKIRASS